METWGSTVSDVSDYSPPGFNLPTDRRLQVHHHGPPQCCQQDPEEYVRTLQHSGSAGHHGKQTYVCR